MRITNLKVRARSDFPVRNGEQFHITDGDGKVVERWRHCYTEEGKTYNYHHYEVEGYPEFTEL